jgi:hypothetical protein
MRPSSRWNRYPTFVTLVGFLCLAAGGSGALAADIVVTNTSDDNVAGTLRFAINRANSASGSRIVFAIPPFDGSVKTISPLSSLPTITRSVTIDGYTQPGSSSNTVAVGDNAVLLIQLDGSQDADFGDGLTIAANNCVIKGLIINNFGGNGISVSEGCCNRIEGNFIGVDATGTDALVGNFGVGLSFDTSSSNVIGGPNPGSRNLISGNQDDGLFISGGSGNVIQGNYIGTDATGLQSLGNSFSGVDLISDTNLVGGTAAGAGNLISGNITFDGVTISGFGNSVQGNFIGVDATGANALSNGASGVSIQYGSNLVGGATAAARNIISGNYYAGVEMFYAEAGSVVQGNYIGTDVSGTFAIGNILEGVSITATSSNLVGGTTPGAGNVISGNGDDGVLIDPADEVAEQNRVQGNFIGTDATGTIALGNGFWGVEFESPNNLIGGTAPGAGNVISGGNDKGVATTSDFATNNLIQGNLIGTDATGTNALGNISAGVSTVSSNIIGGTAPGAGNVISGNGDPEVPSAGVEASSSGNIVQGNLIGTDITGTRALPNQFKGIQAGADTLIGGTNATAGNLISGNTYGIIAGSNILVQGNFIGTDITGTNALPNDVDGIYIDGSAAANNTIGGTATGAGNIIAFNGGNGVTVLEDSTGNAILGNSIFTNGLLGIDLGGDGVTPNHVGFASGPNNFQNFPVLTAATCSNGSVSIQGTITTSTGSGHVVVEFFANEVCNPSGFGEGQEYLGFTNLTVDVSSNTAFDVAISEASFHGLLITATATDDSGNTSEFSECVPIVADLAPPFFGPVSDVTVTGALGAALNAVTFSTPTATGTCSTNVRVVCAPPSGSLFPYGTNLVTSTATDSFGNTATNSFQVIVLRPSDGPDLTGFWLSATVLSKKKNDVLQGSLTVTNQGNALAGKSLLQLYRSTSGTTNDGVLFKKTIRISKLLAGRSKTRKLKFPLPTGERATNQFLIAVIDPGNVVPEIDEENNVISALTTNPAPLSAATTRSVEPSPGAGRRNYSTNAR